MQKIEQTLSSIEVAEMINKEHKMLLRDLRRYITQFNQCKIAPVDFFTESTYKDAKGEIRPCYRITKKGCEFIAHKLTGTKGTIFTARYINRFHKMEDALAGQQEQKSELPWFIKKFNGECIILERDFIQITGVDIRKNKKFYSMDYFTGGVDWNGCDWYTTVDKEAFKAKHGFEYGDEKCLIYLYPQGVIKALRILAEDESIRMKSEAHKMLIEEIVILQEPKKKTLAMQENVTEMTVEKKVNDIPIQINIVLGKSTKI